MRYRRADIVERALEVLDDYGLGDLTMRRLATELGLQPSALYWHFDNKQALLAAVSDEILARGHSPESPEPSWEACVVRHCNALRDAMLSYRDGAELIASTFALGLGAREPLARLVDHIASGGFERRFASSAATTLLHFVLGHVCDEQMHLQANSVGAIDATIDPGGSDSYTLGLAIIIDGIRLRQPVIR